MLAQILNDMIFDADRSAHPIRRKFTNGLHLEIRRDNEDHYTLTLSRDNVLPSLNEWKTVLKHWPYYVQVAPIANTASGNGHRPSLHGEIPVTRMSQLKFE